MKSHYKDKNKFYLQIKNKHKKPKQKQQQKIQKQKKKQKQTLKLHKQTLRAISSSNIFQDTQFVKFLMMGKRKE